MLKLVVSEEASGFFFSKAKTRLKITNNDEQLNIAYQLIISYFHLNTPVLAV
jgi:hypothetical protein